MLITRRLTTDEKINSQLIKTNGMPVYPSPKTKIIHQQKAHPYSDKIKGIYCLFFDLNVFIKMTQRISSEITNNHKASLISNILKSLKFIKFNLPLFRNKILGIP